MIDSDWLADLALHTQIVVKDSEPSYQHGRVLAHPPPPLADELPGGEAAELMAEENELPRDDEKSAIPNLDILWP